MCDLDDDNDGSWDVNDNCRLVANPGQSDVDRDGVGDACDDCPIHSNPDQADLERDHVGDACDNCPLDFNTSQTDSNQDGIGDVCDLADGLIWERRDDKTSVSWQAEEGPASWNLYIGALEVLRSSGTYTQAPGSNPLADRQCDRAQAFGEDPSMPELRSVSFSLVSGVTDGLEGALGRDSRGVLRPNANPCP